MNDKVDKALHIIRPFTLNRPVYTVKHKTEKTLCAFLDEGNIESHPQALKNLIQPAAHLCKNCGGIVVSEKNLCDPEKL